MGEKKKDDKKKDSGEKKADGGSLPLPVVVLKLDLHCDGCAKKVKNSIRHFEGMKTVTADVDGNKLTVTGNVDPVSIKERVEKKTKKKVEIVSPQPKKDVGDGGEKKANDKSPEKKSGDKKANDKSPEKKSGDSKAEAKKPKEVQSTTVVLQIPLHCDGCTHKIKRTVSKIKGVELVIPDATKDVVTVKGTMDVNEVVPFLKEKFKRDVQIVNPKKDEKKDDKKEKSGDGGDKKKEKGSGGGDVEKKKDDGKAAGGGDGVKDGSRSVEVVNKFEYYGQNPYTYTIPAYNQSYYNQDYGVEVSSSNHGYMNMGYVNNGYGMPYSNGGGPPPPPPPMYLHDPRAPEMGMFSDENPNAACSVM